jgi:HEAT repeat protein
MTSKTLFHGYVSVVLLVFVVLGCQRAPQQSPPQKKEAAQVQQPPADNGDVTELSEPPNSEEDAVQAAPADAPAATGDGAAPAVEALIVQLKDEDPHVRAQAARALGQMGKAAVSAAEPLAALVADEDATVRRAAVGALRGIEPDDEMIVPLMLKMLGDADPHVVALATNSLAEEGPEIVPAMIKAMDDERTIYWAILVLLELGPDAKEAVPALAQALSHQHEEIRHEAAQALRAIGPDAKAAVPELMAALDDEQIVVQMPAVLALGSIGPAAKEAAQKVRSLQESDDDLLKVCVMWAIEKMEPDQQRLKTETTPALVNLLLHEDQTVRNAAALAMLQLQPGPDVVAPLFAEAFAKASDEARADMINAAASLGAQAVPRLVLGLDHPNVRQQIIEILGEIGPGAADAVPELLKYADDDDPAVRADVFITLGRIGPAAKAATEAATKALQDSEEEVQSSAVFALGSIGPDAADSVDEIVKLLESGNDRFTTVCAWALIRIQPENHDNCQRAIPLLIEALEHERAFVRVEAASTLGMIGSEANEAIAALEKLADDPDPDVRAAAAEAITQISQ